MPRLVFWYATEKCDLKCKHCCYPSTGRKELSTEEGKKLIEELAKAGVPSLAFIGGEPILREDIFELCSYCIDKGIKPHLITKGYSLEGKDCEKLDKIGVQVTLGIDTFTHRTADTICGIEELPRFSEEALNNCLKYGIYRGIVGAILKPNLEEFISVLGRVSKGDNTRLVVFGIRPAGRGKQAYKEFAPEREAYERVLREIVKGIANKRWTSEVFVYDPIFQRIIEEHGDGIEYDKVKICRIGEYLDIDVQGNMMPCLFAPLRFGNVLEKSLQEAYERMVEDKLLASLREPSNEMDRAEARDRIRKL